jgi:pyridoxine 5'-phosphate synthase PdxJ
LRTREDPNVKPIYTIETFVKEGTNPEGIREEILQVTGTAPQIHDNGTHIVANHKLDYEILKRIQDHPEVEEVTGTYMGSMASIGASHEHSTEESRRASLNRNY